MMCAWPAHPSNFSKNSRIDETETRRIPFLAPGRLMWRLFTPCWKAWNTNGRLTPKRLHVCGIRSYSGSVLCSSATVNFEKSVRFGRELTEIFSVIGWTISQHIPNYLLTFFRDF